MSDQANSRISEIRDKECELSRALRELLVCLGNGHWSEHFRKCLAQLESSSTRDEKTAAATMIRSVYGGMGSFNDWYLNPDSKFGDLDTLRTRVYDLSWLYQEEKT